MSLTKVSYSMIQGSSANVLDFGADPTGATDSTVAFQAALDAAKGANGTGAGRTVFSIYIPTPPGGFYKISSTLLVDGTYGIRIFGDNALTQRQDTTSQATIRWYGTRAPIFQLRGSTDAVSNPNFNIKIQDLTISGYPTAVTPADPIPANMALSGIHIGNIDGFNENTLNRTIEIANVTIDNCRFGIWSGNPDGLNTDHATVNIDNCYILSCPQAGIVWGTGNSIAVVKGCHVVLNGWGSASFPADDYMPQKGANIYVTAGYVDIISLATAGLGTYKPTDADIYQASGRVSIMNAWSDTHGLFFKQESASTFSANGYQIAQITGVRHFEGTMTVGNTPDSIDICAPGTSVISCSFYGNVRLTSGLSGRPICMGINFGRTGATFVGNGVDVQRSLIHHGNAGNFAQSFYGGFDVGQTPSNTGNTPSTTFVIKGDDPGVMEVADGSAGGTNMIWLSRTDDANGSQVQWYMNCYYDTAAGGYLPLQNTKSCWRIQFGGQANPLNVSVADPNGSSGVLTFTDIGGWLVGNSAGFKTEANFVPPKRTVDPTYTSADYWKGGIYYNTTTNKLRVNVGGGTWQDCN